MDRIHIFHNEKIGDISKDIYGFFIEHIVDLIDGGIWVGEDSDIPNIKGIRAELIEKMKQIHTPLLRWGGCTNEAYQWRDGIGPRKDRPISLGLSYNLRGGKVQNNDFGTHEFADFCRLAGADSYITLNVAGTTPLDAFHWIEYCNMPKGVTSLTELRAKNGSPEPFNIKYWGVGNENNEYGGLMTPEEYCSVYSRITSLSQANFQGGVERSFANHTGKVTLKQVVQPSEVIASGPTWGDMGASRRFFESLSSRGHGWGAKRLDGYSLHCYTFAEGKDTEFTEDQWYQTLFDATIIERVITDHIALLQEFDPRNHVKLCIDEWGNWVCFKNGVPEGKPFGFQLGTMRDAIIAALTLNIFNNNCDYVKIATLTGLINYIHSPFMSDGKDMIVTPTYHVFDMMKEHQNATCIRSVSASKTNHGVQNVMASASVKDGKTLITLVNTNYSENTEAVIELHDCLFPENISVEVLSGDTPHAHNTFENPDNVVIKRETVRGEGNELQITLPPASVVSLRFDSDTDEMEAIARTPNYDSIKKRETKYHSFRNIWN